MHTLQNQWLFRVSYTSYRYSMAVSAVWLMQYWAQGARPQGWGLYKLYGTWLACYMYYISQGWGCVRIAR